MPLLLVLQHAASALQVITTSVQRCLVLHVSLEPTPLRMALPPFWSVCPVLPGSTRRGRVPMTAKYVQRGRTRRARPQTAATVVRGDTRRALATPPPIHASIAVLVPTLVYP